MSEITKQEMEFRSGRYKNTVKGMERFLVYHDFKKGLRFGINIFGDWFYDDGSIDNWCMYTSIKVTYQEAESMLIKEAVSRGFKKGATFNHQGSDIYCADDNIYLENNALYYGCYAIMKNGVWVEIVKQEHLIKEVSNPQQHYDNSKGSLYKLADELNLNHWEFDILKRLVRCRKKGQFEQDLNKIKDTVDIYLREFKE